MHNTISLYTDGACSGNPGPGGYGLVLLFNGHRKEMSQGFRKTTNNRMELLSVIVGLETIKQKELSVLIYSDSKYVVEAINQKWVFGWVKKEFKGKANADLWVRFLKIYNQNKHQFIWVKGHATNIENNRCDELAVAASKSAQLSVDEWYEQNKEG
ncbi:MAG: ribonuclease HI [Bacteroidetes bacterium]|nr:ribonuclease HI [Bacteroidota bacterium]MCA6442686.1 ribonuclease HI [Bacteroidota bacterium]